MSEGEAFEYYQNDLTEDFKLDKSKIVRRKKVDLSKATVQISLKLEYELLSDLKQEAENEGIGYQTLMKQIIKNYFHDKGVFGELTEIKNRLSTVEANIAKAQRKPVTKREYKQA